MKLWSRVSLILVAVALAVALTGHWIVSHAVNEALVQESVLRAELLARAATRGGLGTEKDLLPGLMKALEGGASSAYVVGRDGRLLAHSDVLQQGVFINDGLAVRAMLRGQTAWERRGSRLVLAQPLAGQPDAEQLLLGDGRLPIASLVLELSMEPQLRRAAALSRRHLAGVGIVALLILGASSWAVARVVRFFERSLDAMMDGVIVIAGDGRIEAMNPTALALLGGPLAAWRGRDVDEALPGADLSLSLRQGFAARDLELTLRAADGRVVQLLCAANPFAVGDGASGAVVTLKDISARKLLERLEAERERDAMHRDFVATVSHEFRTPVAAIKGFAETLLGGALEDASARREFVEIIGRHSDRLSRLVENLLSLSVLDSPETRDHRDRVELAPFCAQLTRSLAPLVEKAGLRLHLEVAAGLAVSADPEQLEQLLLNLIKNAIEYNRRDGLVSVRAAARGSDAVVTVADTGMGVPADDLDKLFLRFHRSLEAKRRKAQGTGLGLLICRRIVERHGGRIWVESVHGSGASFHFTLPLVRDTFPAAASSNRHETPTDGRDPDDACRRSSGGQRPAGQVAEEAGADGRAGRQA